MKSWSEVSTHVDAGHVAAFSLGRHLDNNKECDGRTPVAAVPSSERAPVASHTEFLFLYISICLSDFPLTRFSSPRALVTPWHTRAFSLHCLSTMVEGKTAPPYCTKVCALVAKRADKQKHTSARPADGEECLHFVRYYNGIKDSRRFLTCVCICVGMLGFSSLVSVGALFVAPPLSRSARVTSRIHTRAWSLCRCRRRRRETFTRSSQHNFYTTIGSTAVYNEYVCMGVCVCVNRPGYTRPALSPFPAWQARGEEQQQEPSARACVVCVCVCERVRRGSLYRYIIAVVGRNRIVHILQGERVKVYRCR